MKKIFTLVIAAVMVISLWACGNKVPEGQVADLFKTGYEVYMSTGSDTELKVMLTNGTDSYLTVTVPSTQSKTDEYFSLDITDENYHDEVCKFLSEQKKVEIENISDEIPTREELDEYIGMTIGEVRELGFENWGSNWGESGVFELIYDNGKITLMFSFDEKSDKDPNEMSMEELDKFVISGVEFSGISSNYFD